MFSRNPNKKILGLFVSVSVVFCLMMSVDVQARDCGEIIGQASEAYAEGRFEDAIQLLDRCLEKPGLDSQPRSRAYRLLGMAYIAMDYRERAKSSITNLLELVPDYKPDPELEGPTFVKIVEDIKHGEKPVPTPIPTPTPAVKTTGFFLSGFLGIRTVSGDDFGGDTFYNFGATDEYFFVPKMDNAFGIGLAATFQTKNVAGELFFNQSAHDFIRGTGGVNLVEGTATNRFMGFNVKVLPLSSGMLRPFVLVGGFLNTINVENGFAKIDPDSFFLFDLRDGELKGKGYNLGAGICVHPSSLIMITGGVTYHSVTFDKIDEIELEETSASTGMDFYVTVGMNLMR